MKKLIITTLSILVVSLIISLSIVKVHGVDKTPFTGQNGSPDDSTLYEATNTFSYVANTYPNAN